MTLCLKRNVFESLNSKVVLFYEDENPIEAKVLLEEFSTQRHGHGLKRSEMGGKRFVYDIEKTLFIVGPLPETKLEFPVLLQK
ncbi:hypothetical protein Tco_1396965 [Tanacetum coccineum]